MSDIERPRVVYIITHAERESGQPNPHLTAQGRGHLAILKEHLPNLFPPPEVIVCGTGKRHLQTAHEIGLLPTRYSEIIGGAEAEIRSFGEQQIMLADGTPVSVLAYTGLEDGRSSACEVIYSLPHNSVVIAGPCLLTRLGYRHAKLCGIYKAVLDCSLCQTCYITAHYERY